MPWAASDSPWVASTSLGWPSAVERPGVVEDHQPVGEVEPRAELVLDDDRRQLLGPGDLGDAGSHGGCADGVEHGGRLVEQQQGRAQRQRTRERQPLLLSP